MYAHTAWIWKRNGVTEDEETEAGREKSRTSDPGSGDPSGGECGPDGHGCSGAGICRVVFQDDLSVARGDRGERSGYRSVFCCGTVPVSAAHLVCSVCCVPDQRMHTVWKRWKKDIFLVFRSDPGSGDPGIPLYRRMRDQLSQGVVFGGGRDRYLPLQYRGTEGSMCLADGGGQYLKRRGFTRRKRHHGTGCPGRGGSGGSNGKAGRNIFLSRGILPSAEGSDALRDPFLSGAERCVLAFYRGSKL